MACLGLTCMSIFLCTVVILSCRLSQQLNRKAFVERLGNEGILRLVEPYKDRSAQAVCTLAYCSDPRRDPVVFVGRLEVFSLDCKKMVVCVRG
jgi:hypothetical protein